MRDRLRDNETRKALYHKRKSQGLCPKCGRPSMNGYSLCESCREYNKATYHWYESHGLCPKCHGGDTMPGKKMCEVCLEQESERNARRYANMTSEQRKLIRESSKRTKQKNIENGLCRDCGKPAWNGRKLCCDCTLKRRKYMEGKHKKYDYKDPDGCFRCGAPCVRGKRLCLEHYQINLENLRKARASKGFEESQKKRKQEISVMWSEMAWNSKQKAS